MIATAATTDVGYVAAKESEKEGGGYNRESRS